ncbi:type VI immunity family protein [Mesorhizobium sp. WSM3224]|uniref:type VI immunity family protein n=1 Tax=Mesorhizobium sp. WSM3224 TaxID=1040986 RepID=UPI00041C24F4|nr:type VI immunity family protein [Mesorhizobium sp. WSM3224]
MSSTRRPSDTFLKVETRFDENIPRWELKLVFVLYFDRPVEITYISRIYDLYMSRFGKRMRRYLATWSDSFIEEFDETVHRRFLDEYLPDFYRTLEWGYAFDDGNLLGAFLFVFHSYKPVSEPNKSSFCRFEFPHDYDQADLQAFVSDVAALAPFTSGSCGFVLQPWPDDVDAFDHMYAVCRRYWGVEAWNQDVTVNWLGNRFKCISWLTLLGASVLEEFPEVQSAARRAAHAHRQIPTGAIYQTRPSPALIDLNRREDFQPEARLAKALLPAQIVAHGSFGGNRWTEDNSVQWLHRFTSS